MGCHGSAGSLAMKEKVSVMSISSKGRDTASGIEEQSVKRQGHSLYEIFPKTLFISYKPIISSTRIQILRQCDSRKGHGRGKNTSFWKGISYHRLIST